MSTQLEHELGRFTKHQRKRIYENLVVIELNEGCSMGCDFCGLDSVRGVRNPIPFKVLEQIAEEIPALTNRITSPANQSKYSPHPNCLFLYDATDPLDYLRDGKNYFEAHALFSAKGFQIGTITAIPAGKEELAIANLASIQHMSISHMNRRRLQPYFARLGVVIFVDLFSYYNAKFGQKYYKKAPVKNRIFEVERTVEETVEQLRNLDHSLPKQARFYDLRLDGNKLHEHVQDFKTLRLFCGNPGKYPREGRVRDLDDYGVANNGRAFTFGEREDEYPDDPREPWDNAQGVKITPNGVFNRFPRHPSREHPVGTIIERVSPEDFRVVKLDRPLSLAYANMSQIPGSECVR